MKKYLALVLACLMVFSLFAGCGNSAKPEASGKPQASGAPVADPKLKTVKIGVFEPASGDNGAGGKQETLGILYAHDMQPTVEIGGETYNVELVTVDNESAVEKGPTAAATLVSAGVSVVLGSYGSGVSIASSDTFKDAGIPAIGVTCTNPAVTEGNTHYFRICFLDPFQGTVLANFAKETFTAKKAYLLAKLGDDYSVGLCNYFKQAFEKLGGEVKFETFPDGTSDYASYVSNAKNYGADVFVSPVSTEAASLIIDQAAAQGVKFPLLAGDTWDSNVVTEAIKGKDLQLYVTTFYQEGGSPEFDAGIKKWINADPTRLSSNNGNDMVAAVSAMGYDAYFTALEALKLAGSTDPKAVNEAIWKTTYKGVSGDIAFDDVNGDAIRDVAYVKQADTAAGAWKFVTVQGIK
ncbi:MAG: ABC transporter substrate-binding protein [Oscillospiraceae bacterium]